MALLLAAASPLLSDPLPDAYARAFPRSARISNEANGPLPRDAEKARIAEGILGWVKETAAFCEKNGLASEAAELSSIDEKRIQSVLAVGTPKDDIPDWERNPYVRAMLLKTRAALKSPFPCVVDAVAVKKAVPNFMEGRRRADELEGLVWAFCHPKSPLRADPALLGEILKRFNALRFVTIDGAINGFYKIDGNHYNVFIVQHVMAATHMLTQTFPGVLPPPLARSMDRFFREGIEYQLNGKQGHRKDELGIIANMDAEIVLFGELGFLLTGNREIRGLASDALAHLATNQYPDGAWPYYLAENECYSYHGAVIRCLAAYERLTGSSEARRLIVASTNYYPLATEPGGAPEYGTAPSWKQFWNTSGTVAEPQIVAAHSGDARNHHLAASQIEILGDGLAGTFFSQLLGGARAFRPVVGLEAPAPRRLVFDRNIQGVRGRQETFSFWMDGRDRTVPERYRSLVNGRDELIGSHLGKAGAVGAMIVDSFDSFASRNAIFYRAGHRALMATNVPAWQGSVSLSVHESNRVWASEDAAVLTTRYEFGGSTFGPRFVPDSNFEGREAWLARGSRLFGYVEIEARRDVFCHELTGRLLFGAGAAGEVKAKKLVRVGDRGFEYGEMAIVIHESDYDEFSTIEKAPHFRDDRKTASELVLSESNATRAGRNYPKGFRRHFVVEIFPRSLGKASVLSLSSTENLISLTIDGKDRFLYNRTSGPVALPIEKGNRTVDPDPFGERATPQPTPATSIELAPGSAILWTP